MAAARVAVRWSTGPRCPLARASVKAASTPRRFPWGGREMGTPGRLGWFGGAAGDPPGHLGVVVPESVPVAGDGWTAPGVDVSGRVRGVRIASYDPESVARATAGSLVAGPAAHHGGAVGSRSARLRGPGLGESEPCGECGRRRGGVSASAVLVWLWLPGFFALALHLPSLVALAVTLGGCYALRRHAGRVPVARGAVDSRNAADDRRRRFRRPLLRSRPQDRNVSR